MGKPPNPDIDRKPIKFQGNGNRSIKPRSPIGRKNTNLALPHHSKNKLINMQTKPQTSAFPSGEKKKEKKILNQMPMGHSTVQISYQITKIPPISHF